MLQRFVPDAAALAEFVAPDRVALHTLTLREQIDSSIDGASKLVVATEAGLLAEAVVLRIASGRSTVCVSSQVGCAAACTFCATGTMGIARSLSAEEILDQVVLAGQLLATEGRALNNVVFMGMGEPFHNEAHVTAAVDALLAPKRFGLSPRKVLVSSVGIVEGMLRFAQRFADVGLALSLHSARADVREQLIPLAKRTPLSELRRMVVELGRICRRPVMLEMLMLDGLTDRPRDLEALLAWTQGLAVHINLIPYNAVDGVNALRGSARPAIAAFADGLKAAGRVTTIRRSLGQDIAAACGQLVKVRRAAEASHA